MNVAVLQQYLEGLAAPLRAAGASAKVADDLARTAQSLTPFANMSLADFAELLIQAAEYRRTGVLPVKAGRGKAAPAVVDQAKVRQLAQQVLELSERAAGPGVLQTEIDERLKKLDRAMTKDEALAVAREVGVVRNVKTKKDALAELRHKVFQRREALAGLRA